ncbi:hypothetical protein C8R43DRAFT_1120856 [Mycena crocata]|nr:hypothetical protein C8R43DRAFT_1120856 [Mycena crocata]
MAVASGKVERVAQLVRACFNNNVGIRGLVERYQRACEAVYNPKGFSEDDMMLGLLILRLGGARLAGIIHRVIGLPGLSTLRKNTIIRPLRASPGVPTLAEIEENLEICAEGHGRSIWCSLSLSEDPRVYSPRPCLISGTDKHEDSVEHAKLLQKIINAGHNKGQRSNIIYRTVSLASDGESRRGLALVPTAMNRLLSDQTPIHPLLSVLQLMNLRVGEDDRTPDKDYRHQVKTLRTLLMRLKGIQVMGFVVTPAIIKQHLRANGHSQEQVNAFLNPNDKQDIWLGYQFLKSLWSLPPAAENAEPTFAAARAARCNCSADSRITCSCPPTSTYAETPTDSSYTPDGDIQDGMQSQLRSHKESSRLTSSLTVPLSVAHSSRMALRNTLEATAEISQPEILTPSAGATLDNSDSFDSTIE